VFVLGAKQNQQERTKSWFEMRYSSPEQTTMKWKIAFDGAGQLAHGKKVWKINHDELLVTLLNKKTNDRTRKTIDQRTKSASYFVYRIG
jgi:hypothetical protein